MANEMKIKIRKNGPYIVTGNIPLYTEELICDENEISIKFDNKEQIESKNTYTLCRCGKSNNKPFCDGNHIKENFKGIEEASKKIYEENLTIFETNNLILYDAVELCDHSRFCLGKGGIRRLMEKEDEDSIALAKEEARNCPSGRLTIIDKKTEESTEIESEKEIIIIYDQGKDCEGPIWVKGKIPLESNNGNLYEKRNRMTLCGCGKSKIKPFCDGNHWIGPETESKFRKKWNLK